VRGARSDCLASDPSQLVRFRPFPSPHTAAPRPWVRRRADALRLSHLQVSPNAAAARRPCCWRLASCRNKTLLRLAHCQCQRPLGRSTSSFASSAHRKNAAGLSGCALRRSENLRVEMFYYLCVCNARRLQCVCVRHVGFCRSLAMWRVFTFRYGVHEIFMHSRALFVCAHPALDVRW